GHGQQGLVASAGPGGGVRCGEQCVDLVGGEELDDLPDGALGWDREDLGDRGSVLGMVGQGPGEHGTDRGQPGVAGPGAVATLVFGVVEEPGDVRRGDGVDFE